MSLPIVFRAVAQEEFDQAAAWYDERREGLGTEFVAEIQQALDRIVAQPDRFAKVLEDVHEAPVRRFPFCIYYRLQTDRISVIAVFHSSRDPSSWKSRI